MKIFEILVGFFGPLSIVTFFGIMIRFKMDKKYTLTQINYNPFWLGFIFEYKNHTTQKYGKAGMLYYLFIISILITVFSLLTQAGIWIYRNCQI